VPCTTVITHQPNSVPYTLDKFRRWSEYSTVPEC
jgi:hypothetical protein